MRTIRCSCGRDILVDDIDYERLACYSWTCNGRGAVYRVIATEKGSRCLNIAWVIIIVPEGLEAEHKDLNFHNNQRSNLRTATKSQNVANRGLRSDNVTGYKGVSFDVKRGKFRAAIKYLGKKKFLGYFENIHLAAAAYNEAAIRLFGEYARVNTLPLSESKKSLQTDGGTASPPPALRDSGHNPKTPHT